MSDKDGFAALDEALAAIEERMERCRRAMLLSRIALVAAAIAFVYLLLFGSFERSPSLTLAVFAGFFGAVVWLGASRSSREQAARELAEVEARRNALIDVAAAHQGWRDITPTVH